MDAISELSVLVIDDYAVMRRIVRGLLRDIGIMAVTEAEHGGEALEILADQDCTYPDVIICDLFMDGMSGTEFIHRVRRSKILLDSKVPIILLTGEQEGMIVDVARQVGASRVLHKPLPPEVLHSTIAQLVGYQIESPSKAVSTVENWRLETEEA